MDAFYKINIDVMQVKSVLLKCTLENLTSLEATLTCNNNRLINLMEEMESFKVSRNLSFFTELKKTKSPSSPPEEMLVKHNLKRNRENDNDDNFQIVSHKNKSSKNIKENSVAVQQRLLKSGRIFSFTLR